jgi:transporter family-2 protein
LNQQKSKRFLFNERQIMTQYVLLIIVAAIGGIAAVLQAQFMGLLDRGLGTIESVFITYAGGGLLICIPVIALRGGNLSAWQNVPWYSFAAGLMGLIIVGSIGYCVHRLGIVTAFTIIVASQFISGALLDHYGILGATIRPLDLSRLGGIGFLLLGVWLILR